MYPDKNVSKNEILVGERETERETNIHILFKIYGEDWKPNFLMIPDFLMLVGWSVGR